MMKKAAYIIYLAIGFVIIGTAGAEDDLSRRLSGRILLQVEAHGEAWYVNPADSKRYFLGRPDHAFDLIRRLGDGITNVDLDKIPVGFMLYDDGDDDGDGLANRLEEALGTDPQKADTDGDGYNDKMELESGYSPVGNGRLPLDADFSCRQAGKIFLQVQNLGQAWYVDSTDCRRYYLGRPADAFEIMKSFGLGITDENLSKIPASIIRLGLSDFPSSSSTPPSSPNPICPTCDKGDAGRVFAAAASAIRSGNKNEAADYFIPEMKKAIEYSMDFLNAEGRLALGNIMSGATLSESTDLKKTYSTEVYFSLGGYKIPVEFNLEKQTDGVWLLVNL